MQTQFSLYKKTTSLCCRFIVSISCLCFFSAEAQQPFRYDNVLYKAVYWNDAARLMNENPNHLILDVRTPGEYADTSQYTHMNMGHLKGAININIDSFSQHLEELKKYSNENIFVYCSHSQRSRRVSKLLAENGFKNVYNINGGMSVANESTENMFPFKKEILVSGNSYQHIASTDALELIQKPGVVIIDVRSKSEFNSKDSEYNKNLGYIKNAVNIPSAEFKDKFEVLNIPKAKTILLYDQSGLASTDAAAEVVKLGYTHVYNLFEGLVGFMCDNHLDPSMIKKVTVNPPPFKVVGVRECIDLLSKPNNFFVIDARPSEEFNNKSSKEYLNAGRLENAMNVTSVEALEPVINNINKDANILVYGSYSGNTDEIICKALIEKGYKNVYYLYQGIGRFVWACFNIENCREGINVLTYHNGLY
jgi:rhodanese-related sulfurtransferase